MSAEEKSSHWLSFVLLLTLCAPKILRTNDGLLLAVDAEPLQQHRGDGGDAQELVARLL